MPYLTAGEIAEMRDEVLDTQLDMICTIQRPAAGPADPNNHPTFALQAHLTGIPCHYWEAPERELEGEVNVTITKEHIVLQANTDVTTKDRISSVIGVDGNQIAGPLAIEQVIERLNHTELIVEGIGP